MIDDTGFAQEERRIHHAVREIFIRGCVLFSPFIEDNDDAFGISAFAMPHMVQDHFPGLSGQEAHILIAAIERLHRENRLQALIERQDGFPGTG